MAIRNPKRQEKMGFGVEDAGRLYSRFRRGRAGDERGAGTGLGLAIARELARRWSADVSLENAPDGGAIATLRFAAAGDQVQA